MTSSLANARPTNPQRLRQVTKSTRLRNCRLGTTPLPSSHSDFDRISLSHRCLSQTQQCISFAASHRTREIDLFPIDRGQRIIGAMFDEFARSTAEVGGIDDFYVIGGSGP